MAKRTVKRSTKGKKDMKVVVAAIQKVIKGTKGRRDLAPKTKKLRTLLKSARAICDGFYI